MPKGLTFDNDLLKLIFNATGRPQGCLPTSPGPGYRPRRSRAR